MQNKSKAFHFKSFKTLVRHQTSYKIKILIDGGNEYYNHSFDNFLVEHEISHQLSCPYKLEQNGVSMQIDCHLIETMRPLLHSARLSYDFWDEGLNIVANLINRMPSLITKNQSPYELFFQQKPTCNHLKVFGCSCFPWIPSSRRYKLNSKMNPYVFLDYESHHKGYRYYNLLTRRLIILMHVIFDELFLKFSDF